MQNRIEIKMMSVFRKFAINNKYYKRILAEEFAVVFGVCTCLQLFDINVPFLFNFCSSFVKRLVLLLVIVVIVLLIALWRICRYHSATLFEKGDRKLVAIYGDIITCAFDSSKDTEIIVVPVNTSFDTIVDDPQKDSKPLVSINSIHGKMLRALEERKLSRKNIEKQIAQSLAENDYSPKRIDNKARGNKEVYDIGTVATIKYKKTVLYLLAISEFDDSNNAHSSRDEIIKAVECLISYYNKHGQGFKMYIPLLGTNLSRANLSPRESYEIIKSEFILHSDILTGEVNIVVLDKQREEVSIYE